MRLAQRLLLLLLLLGLGYAGLRWAGVRPIGGRELPRFLGGRGFQDRYELAVRRGSSLVVVEVLSVSERDPPQFRARVVQTIIQGDLTDQDTRNALTLIAGARDWGLMKSGRHYAVLLNREAPLPRFRISREDVLPLDPRESAVEEAMIQQATRAYQGSEMQGFRESSPVAIDPLPDLPREVLDACQRFRSESGDRIKEGRLISASVMGSRARPRGSPTSHLPPEISVTRDQALALLGPPTMISGWSYYWYCGLDLAGGTRPWGEPGVLWARFARGHRTVHLRYGIEAGWQTWSLARDRRMMPPALEPLEDAPEPTER